MNGANEELHENEGTGPGGAGVGPQETADKEDRERESVNISSDARQSPDAGSIPGVERGGNRTQFKWINGVLISIVSAIIGTAVGIVLAIWIGDHLRPEQPFIAESSVTIDTHERRQGTGAVEWSFHVQPARKWFTEKGRSMGCFAHLEVAPNDDGRLKGIDLSDYDAIEFFTKSTSEFLTIHEFNVFVGDQFVQYVCSTKAQIIPSTKWRKLTIAFGSLKLADFLLDSMSRAPATVQFPLTPDWSNVTGLGWDMKTTEAPLFDRVWFDYVMVRGPDDRTLLLSDCDSLTAETLGGRKLHWVSDWRKYGRL